MKFILHILSMFLFLFQFTQISYTQTTASNTKVAASTTGITYIIENLN